MNFVVEVIPVVSHTFYLLSLSSLQRPWCLKISQIQKLICTFFEYFPIALPYFTREAMMKILPFYMRSNDEDIAVLNEKQWWSYYRVHEKQWCRYCRFTWEAMMKILPFTWEAMMKILPFYMRSNDEDVAVLHEKQWWRCLRFTWEAKMKILQFNMRSNDEDIAVLHEKQWWRYCRFTWEAMMKILPFFIHLLHCLCGIHMHK